MLTGMTANVARTLQRPEKRARLATWVVTFLVAARSRKVGVVLGLVLAELAAAAAEKGWEAAGHLAEIAKAVREDRADAEE
jgi:hypothetical protein